ncbi:adenylate/guanylate cyclase domain-containing protein [Marinobacterium mangrovicola]|uniref:Class 3 adenylate cyclase n=1 Tax=Marinobacterium mangrovicola TaxID=1476959 RepID=A0A4V2PEE5_9GAMM|nr:adenylate/guanylate cyclase domain-containing protein [Marinobacterium mangrovicola]TCK08736.1 class 3 adenylate cyclase [Marinobacterium mangrovicola]
MDKSIDTRALLQQIHLAVALVDIEQNTICFENACFFDWFPPPAQEQGDFSDRVPSLELEKAKQRLQARGSYRLEVDVQIKGRATPVRIEMHQVEYQGQARTLVEARDISKEKESQYMLDSYSRLAEKNAKALEREKDRVERLLLNVMPKQVYEELKNYGTTTPQHFENAAILMLDFVRFTDMQISHDASALVSELNDIFSAFDRIVEMFGCERIRTIGDSYMAVSGVPEESGEDTANIARVALRMRRYLEKRNSAHSNQWRGRIGINTGPVIGSLVGIQKYVYDLFGPGVNLAARMESHSEPMRITLNQATYELLKDDFICTERGEAEIKGFGPMTLYFLEEEARQHYR